MAMTFDVDNFGWVRARLPNGGSLKSQNVEALLLFEILRYLETQNDVAAHTTPQPSPAPAERE